MSRLQPLVNGDSSGLDNAALAGADGRAMRNRECIREDWGERVGKMFVAVDHMYASVNDVQTRSHDKNAKFKNLIFSHLDMIHKQSELIHSKDKHISKLQKENDMLRSRIQRMERRVTLNRLRDKDVVAGPSEVPATVTTAIEVVDCPVEAAAACAPATASNNAIEPVSKRRRPSAGSTGRYKRRGSSSCSARKRSRSTSEPTVSDKRFARVPLTDPSGYFTLAGDNELSPLDVSIPEEPDPALQGEDQVQVPSWREKILSPQYVIEGTELLDDVVFLKRHQKLETDERRRKRWDIQRIRDQLHVEKLKSRRLKSRGSQSETKAPAQQLISSFYPSPDELQEIYIDSNLPVTAFGLQLRTLEPSEFSLTWSTQPCATKNLRHR